jgi:NADPH-dependent glutamate synthase beta subunit-like oxidoreductase
MGAGGIGFRTGAWAGRNVSVEDLRKEFDAILPGGGAEQARESRSR